MRYQPSPADSGRRLAPGVAMPFVDEDTASAYRAAWDAWNKQLQHLHRVFLEGESIRPDQIKGLLNREARAKERYDAARLRLLGLDQPTLPADADSPLSR